MTTDYLAHAREFLNLYVDTLEDLWNLHNSYRWAQFCKEHNLEFHSGQTRVVFVGDDFVIKLDKKHIGRWARFGNCYQEYQNWKMVQADGFDYLFASITKMKVGHHYYYVMPRVAIIDHGLTSWAWNLDDLTSEEKGYLRSTFEDLHEYNYGFDDEGNLKIFDYAVTSEYYYSH